ncbi:hypothetical protein CONPUDRAFT_146327 [Coniophora puteana RWD-64-598 SS2]|uniref:Uncharacterized protein n=1 Tax=Coniophora puteana (strain RWD-64-598) TaxID=741705 RepID=A0A5M3MEK6_CONPW|nr:uncharacterized protein CONPUDRAFT_146327 [Coniophora puteana RWD-64-598 SS2]EIW77350.1 hypothetical protein CONPUDRAFT_146327 [Coniophora puteana RWD-64-598 SS2]
MFKGLDYGLRCVRWNRLRGRAQAFPVVTQASQTSKRVVYSSGRRPRAAEEGEEGCLYASLANDGKRMVSLKMILVMFVPASKWLSLKAHTPAAPAVLQPSSVSMSADRDAFKRPDNLTSRSGTTLGFVCPRTPLRLSLGLWAERGRVGAGALTPSCRTAAYTVKFQTDKRWVPMLDQTGAGGNAQYWQPRLDRV